MHRDVPLDVESCLTSDEKVLKNGTSREWEIYVTDKRVIFKKGGIFGKEIVEASYRHISSIEYKKQSPFAYIILGIVLIISAVIVHYSLRGELFLSILGLAFGVALGVMGVASIVASFFVTPTFKIHVIGREPLTISHELEDIIRIIRQYREKVEAEVVQRE